MKKKKLAHKSGLKSYNMDKILGLFYENPGGKFTIREMEKNTKIPKSTIQKYLEFLKESGLINKDNTANENLFFKTKKINFYIEKIVSSGLIDELIKKLNPLCIILFGSIRKGESDKESDLDLFIETYSKNKINLSEFEKKLGHRISIFSETKIIKLHDDLFNNVVNGIKLYGSFKIR